MVDNRQEGPGWSPDGSDMLAYFETLCSYLYRARDHKLERDVATKGRYYWLPRYWRRR